MCYVSKVVMLRKLVSKNARADQKVNRTFNLPNSKFPFCFFLLNSPFFSNSCKQTFKEIKTIYEYVSWLYTQGSQIIHRISKIAICRPEIPTQDSFVDLKYGLSKKLPTCS